MFMRWCELSAFTRFVCYPRRLIVFHSMFAAVFTARIPEASLKFRGSSIRTRKPCSTSPASLRSASGLFVAVCVGLIRWLFEQVYVSWADYRVALMREVCFVVAVCFESSCAVLLCQMVATGLPVARPLFLHYESDPEVRFCSVFLCPSHYLLQLTVQCADLQDQQSVLAGLAVVGCSCPR